MAREIVDGYYLTLKNDTVRCKIEPRGLEVFDRVTIEKNDFYFFIVEETGPQVSHLADLREFVRNANYL